MHPSGPCRTQLSPDLWPCSEVIRLRTLQRRVRERLLFPEVKGNSLVIFCYLICGGYLICCFFFIINLSACPPTHCSFYLTRQMDVDGLSLRYINCNHNSALTNEQMNASNKDLRTNNLKDRKQSDTRRPYIWIIGDLPQLTPHLHHGVPWCRWDSDCSASLAGGRRRLVDLTDGLCRDVMKTCHFFSFSSSKNKY